MTLAVVEREHRSIEGQVTKDRALFWTRSLGQELSVVPVLLRQRISIYREGIVDEAIALNSADLPLLHSDARVALTEGIGFPNAIWAPIVIHK